MRGRHTIEGEVEHRSTGHVAEMSLPRQPAEIRDPVSPPHIAAADAAHDAGERGIDRGWQGRHRGLHWVIAAKPAVLAGTIGKQQVARPSTNCLDIICVDCAGHYDIRWLCSGRGTITKPSHMDRDLLVERPDRWQRLRFTRRVQSYVGAAACQLVSIL